MDGESPSASTARANDRSDYRSRRARSPDWNSSAAVALTLCVLAGCVTGPRALQETRLQYNEIVKSTTEQQLLLNIVRLRYTDTPSSLSIASVAAQFEVAKSLQLMPFFVASGAEPNRSYAAVLPQVGVVTADRPTFSLVPLDDQEFTRKLFTPIGLDGVIYLAKTTWPIATVFRLYLENLNWVSNAETASGPTPKEAPVYADFRRGVEALQALQTRGQVVFAVEEQDQPVGGPLPAPLVRAADVIEAAKNGYELRPDPGGQTWTPFRKVRQPVLRIDPNALGSADVDTFVRMFHLKPGVNKYPITVGALQPFSEDDTPAGFEGLDLETRSLLQALYYVSHGVEIPPEHIDHQLVRITRYARGDAFDWGEVTGDLFRVRSSKGEAPPPEARVAVLYRGYWFYIEASDHDTMATFSLLMELSRLELQPKTSGDAPVFTLPLGR